MEYLNRRCNQTVLSTEEVVVSRSTNRNRLPCIERLSSDVGDDKSNAACLVAKKTPQCLKPRLFLLLSVLSQNFRY